jgi:hypothetical protein
VPHYHMWISGVCVYFWELARDYKTKPDKHIATLFYIIFISTLSE